MAKEKYTRCVWVDFGGIKGYLYKCPFPRVEVGDEVDVPVLGSNGQETKRVLVRSVDYYTSKDAPYPLEYMKTVTALITPHEDYIKDLNPPEVRKAIAKIKDLDKQVHDYCINNLICDEEYLLNPFILGKCHTLWYAKKKLLKEKYNIDWLTPTECNPGAIFD